MVGRIARRLWYLLNRRRLEAQLRDEMEAHREMMGEPARFGNVLRLREEARDAWEWQWLDRIARDVRHGAASLWRARGYTATIVVSLALGFALASSTMAIVNAYLIQPLPYADPGRLYHVRYAPPGPWEPRGLSTLDWTAVSDVVETPIVARGDTLYLDDGRGAQSARTLRVTPGVVTGLGVRAATGRTFVASDFVPGGERAALIGDGLWRDRYGSDPSVLGRTVRAESESRRGEPVTLRIVGVLPREFYFGRDSSVKIDFLIPETFAATPYLLRLRAGVPVAYAQDRLTTWVRGATSGIPGDWPGVVLESVRDRYVAQLRPVLRGLTGASALVLLIVCANASVLVLLRTMRRQKELAVRASLGSSRRDLAFMLATETAMLCTASLVLGLAITWTALGVLGPLVQAQLGLPAPRGVDGITIDATVLVVTGGLGLAIACALALLPLAMPWQERLAAALRTEGPRSTDGPAARRLRSGLIAFEVAGTLVLVIACGLLLRGVVSMARTDLGFTPDGLVRGRIVLRAAGYPTPAAFFAYYEAFRERLAQTGGGPVVFANWPPFAEFPDKRIEAEDRSGAAVTAGAIAVGGEYFSTLRILLRAGREFTPADVTTDSAIAVVSESLARHLWPEGAAVGRRLRIIEPSPEGTSIGPWRTVVGVAGDVRQAYDDRVVDDVYTPLTPGSFGRYASFYTRTTAPVAAAVEMARSVASELDRRAVIDLIWVVPEENRQIAGATVLMQLLAVFTLVTAIIAVIGIYGVTAYGVQQRQREIAVRMALGASSSAVLRLFLRQSGWVVGIGLACGSAGAFAAARVLRSGLETIGSLDTITVTASVVVLGLVGMLATWLPARQGTRRSPLDALKES